MSIRSELANGVAVIEIARPEKRNALTADMYTALASALEEAQTDASARAVLLRGQPQVFTAGNDLEDFLAHPPQGEDAPVYRFMRSLIACDKPVITAVTGAAVGIGTTLLLHCDLVYAAEDARFGLPFVTLGLVPEFASSALLPALAGTARIGEQLLLGESFGAAQALQLGLLTGVLPPGEVLAHAQRQAERCAHLPVQAVRDTKRLMRAGRAALIERALQAEGAIFVERLRSPEARAAFEAFVNKRRGDSPRRPSGAD
ncbi:MAG TPA: enoyl-CoA hydratase [Steroidobacteraceae bacterium]|nr:enoyl-CoA hydratase [Steroidobacteraceae bacterium]